MPDASDRSGRQPRTRPADRTPPPPRCVRVPGFVLISRSVRGVDRVELAGELTMATAGLLDTELILLQHRPAAPNLLLDLTDVTVLDVMGVQSLRRADELARCRGGMRLGLPIAQVPRQLLGLATEHGWLPPAFRPATPTL